MKCGLREVSAGGGRVPTCHLAPNPYSQPHCPPLKMPGKFHACFCLSIFVHTFGSTRYISGEASVGILEGSLPIPHPKVKVEELNNSFIEIVVMYTGTLGCKQEMWSQRCLQWKETTCVSSSLSTDSSGKGWS